MARPLVPRNAELNKKLDLHPFKKNREHKDKSPRTAGYPSTDKMFIKRNYSKKKIKLAPISMKVIE